MCAFSIIIPVLNEADRIINLVSDLSRLDPDYDKEIIVVDGSPDCDTIRAITDPNIHCITSSCGRARQMNAGAAEAKVKFLFFCTPIPACPIMPLLLLMPLWLEMKLQPALSISPSILYEYYTGCSGGLPLSAPG